MKRLIHAFAIRALCALLLAPALAAPIPAPAAAQQVKFGRLDVPADGKTHRVVGRVRGEVIEDRIFTGKAGQRLALRLEVVHPSFRLELLPPEGDPLFTGGRLADRYEGTLPADGYYTLRVKLAEGAAGRGERVSYVMGVTLSP